MRVMDKEVSEKDRAEIQETMLGPKVLDTAQLSRNTFPFNRGRTRRRAAAGRSLGT